MKKLIALFLALMLPLCASAATVTGSHEAQGVVYMGVASNTYIVQSDAGFQIFAADGTALGPVWGNMGPKLNGAYYQVLYNGGYSAVNGKGELVLADDYFGFVTTGEDWLLGIVMEETNDANADYTSRAGAKMNVVRADVCVGGKLVGSLDRSQYLTSASAGALGEYLYVMHADGRTLFFDKTLKQTAEVVLTEKPEEEFVEVGGKYIHVPTQQVAFCAESTLTEDQVSQKAMLVEDQVIGLQGNVLFTLPKDGLYKGSVRGDYVHTMYSVPTGLGCGLWNLEGKSLVPAEYEYVGNGYSASGGFYNGGYQPVLTWNGDLYYYDQAGNVTASVTGMQLGFSKMTGFLESSPILVCKGAASYRVITATHGLLSEEYEDGQQYDGIQLVAVCKNGAWGCIGLDGATVVPFEYEGIAISADGTLVMGQKPNGTWVAYNIAY